MRQQRRTRVLIPALLATVAATSACTDESGRSVEAYERLKSSSNELLEAARDLGEAQGEELAERAQAYLADLDRRIAELREETGEAAEQRLRQLEQRRQELAPKVEALKNASGEAWEDVRQGFAEALDEFERADEGR